MARVNNRVIGISLRGCAATNQPILKKIRRMRASILEATLDIGVGGTGYDGLSRIDCGMFVDILWVRE